MAAYIYKYMHSIIHNNNNNKNNNSNNNNNNFYGAITHKGALNHNLNLIAQQHSRQASKVCNSTNNCPNTWSTT